MKKLSLLNIFIITCILFTGCTTKTSDENMDFSIGINQFMEHPALDDAREGFIDRLEELNIKTNIDYKNSQGDIPNSISISEKFKSDKVDLIYTIGTPAAQSTKQVTTEIPILFSAVTDPIEAGLITTKNNNITGTSDVAPIDKQIKLFKKLDPNIKTIGIIYNINESNSEAQIKYFKEYSKKENLNVEIIGVNNINDIPQSLDSIIKKSDAIYILSDNMIASSVGLVSEKLIENNMISVSAEESQVEGGILITEGLSYYELGRQTADMVKDILVDKKDIQSIPFQTSKNNEIKINKNTWDKLNLDKNIDLYKNYN